MTFLKKKRILEGHRRDIWGTFTGSKQIKKQKENIACSSAIDKYLRMKGSRYEKQKILRIKICGISGSCYDTYVL